MVIVTTKDAMKTKWAPLADREYKGEPVSLAMRDQSIQKPLLAIADVANKKLIIKGTPNSTISIALQDVPWDLALDIIVAQHGLSKAETDETIVVTLPD